MDPSNNSIGTTHLTQREHSNGYTDFLGGIHNFAAATEQPLGHDDIEQFFDPALFASSAQDGSATSHQGPPQQGQQQSNYQSAFNQHATRQSQSPALPAYNPSQHHFTHQSQFTQPVYDPRANMYQNQQPTFDPRFYQQRPSHSPAPLEQYQYPPSNFSAQNYPQPQIGSAGAQSNTPTPNFSQHQQSYSPFINFDSRTSGHMQTQNSHMIQYSGFQEANQKPSHGFVNPSLLNAGQESYMTNQYPQAPQRPIQPSAYLHQAGQTIDPRSLGHLAVQPTQQQVVRPLTDQQQTGAVPQFESNLPLKKKAARDPNAPKKPRGRPRKDGSAPMQSGQGLASESDSDSDLSIEEEPEKTPALLSVQMPSDERGKAMFLAIQAVWSPRNLSAPVDKIKSGLVQFGEIIKGLRDSWKEKNESLKKAELPNAPTALNAARLKNEVAHYRQVVETVVNRSLQLAHPAILKRLGENQWTMSAMYALMLDRVTVGDYDSSLVLSILKLAVNFETLDEEKLEATKWPKLLQRLAKKATTESKALSQQMLNNAAIATKKKAENVTNGDVAAGVKRGRDGEPVALKKTIVKPSSKPLALQNAERRRAEAAEAAKKSAKAGSTVNGNAVNASTQKSKIVVQQPPKLQSFAALMSASKRPGTSIAERAAAAKEKPVSTNQQLKESPPPNGSVAADSKGSSSLQGYLSALEKKEEAKPVKVEEPKNETPEQKQKRLRKETRRKLRVSWKAEPELVETRVFTHDPDEELGHTESSMRDAGDTTSEGEMLKRHKGMEDLDDEESEDEPEPELLIEYTMPVEVDLTELDEILSVNGSKFGGSLEITSPSREAQDNLESNTVMVVFASQADRPETPKEPPDEGEDADFQPCMDFGEVPEKIRLKEKEVYARTPQPGLQGLGAAGGSGQMDLSQILSMLKPQGGMQLPAQSAPAAQFDFEKLMLSVKQVQQQYQGQGQGQGQAQSIYQPPSQQQPQPQPQPQVAQPAQPSNAPDLSSLLASFQQVANATGNQSALPLGAGSNPNPFPGAGGAEKHTLDTSDYTQSQQKGKKKKGNPPKTVVAPVEGGLPANYKTQTCQFWLEGKCNKGDHCTYRHDRMMS